MRVSHRSIISQINIPLGLLNSNTFRNDHNISGNSKISCDLWGSADLNPFYYYPLLIFVIFLLILTKCNKCLWVEIVRGFFKPQKDCKGTVRESFSNEASGKLNLVFPDGIHLIYILHKPEYIK